MVFCVGDLLKLLNLSLDEKILPTTYGELRPPLGKHRLKVSLTKGKKRFFLLFCKSNRPQFKTNLSIDPSLRLDFSAVIMQIQLLWMVCCLVGGLHECSNSNLCSSSLTFL